MPGGGDGAGPLATEPVEWAAILGSGLPGLFRLGRVAGPPSRRALADGRHRPAGPLRPAPRQGTRSPSGTGSPAAQRAMLAKMRETVGAKVSAERAAMCGVVTAFSRPSSGLSGGTGSVS